MPNFDFQCSSCDKVYEALTVYDASGVYDGVVCPKCQSNKKTKLIGCNFNIGGPTSSKMDNFGYRAGFNMEKAQDCRRAAEAASHMGADPYSTGEFGKVPDDFQGDEGIFHPSAMPTD